MTTRRRPIAGGAGGFCRQNTVSACAAKGGLAATFAESALPMLLPLRMGVAVVVLRLPATVSNTFAELLEWGLVVVVFKIPLLTC